MGVVYQPPDKKGAFRTINSGGADVYYDKHNINDEDIKWIIRRPIKSRLP